MGRQRKKGNHHHHDDDEEEEEDLERFAGSSAEEDNVDEDQDYDEKEEEEYKDEMVPMKLPINDHNDTDDDDDKNYKGNSSDDSDDDDDQERSGIANAMARILGTATKVTATHGTKPMVLSKTTTRIQKQIAKEKQEIQQNKEKRHYNRQRELSAMHIPLSVATSLPVVEVNQHDTTSNNSTTGTIPKTSIAQELEQERIHRRVATRGVVALFNAIAQHQNQVTKEQEATLGLVSSSSHKKKDTVPPSKMTKHGFLDMIKSKAVEKTTTNNPKTTTTTTTTNTVGGGTGTSGWKALQDDYMLQPPKNWDQESSEEEEEEEDHSDDNNDDDIIRGNPNKKQKAVAA
jgi:hypothetical protein